MPRRPPPAPLPPATMPADAVGFLARHPSKPERLALLRPDGSVSVWFSRGDDLASLAEILAASGFRLLDDGSVVRAG